jgi:hypothetical protein
MDLKPLSLVPFENIYHIGVVCPDIERGMREVAGQLGITWAPRRTATVTVKEPTRDASTVGLEVVYSRNGPPYLELIEAKGDGVWSGSAGPRLHHLGIYVDDLAGETARLERSGMKMEAHGVDGEGRLALFGYLLSATGIRVEVVDARGREGLLQWVRA